MGRRDRERVERIAQGLENPIARTAVKLKARSGVIETLKQAPTDDIIETFQSTVMKQKPSKLRDALKKKTPSEMRKGIKRQVREGRIPTVDTLMEEYRSPESASFRKMTDDLGLTEEWFMQIAEEELRKYGDF